MTDPQVDVPVVGTVPKQAVYGAGAFLVGFVGYAYYKRAKARKAAAAAAAAAPVDPGFSTSDGSGGTLPVVPGNAPGGYGIPTTGNQSTAPAGSIVTNADWAQAVRDRLAGTYPDAALVGALGLFLNAQPLSPSDTAIIQAAIAVAGYPPVGNLHILSGGGSAPTGLLPAPVNVHSMAVSSTGCEILWDPVPGASHYYVYDAAYGGIHTRTITDPQVDVAGRSPGSVVGPIEITAVAQTGQESPRSSPISVQLDPGAAPAPAPAPAPGPAPAPAPAPAQPAYPQYWTSHTNVSGDSYSKIAAEYGLNISGDDLYAYQFTPEAGRPPATLATLRSRRTEIFAGGETEIPYPRR